MMLIVLFIFMALCITFYLQQKNNIKKQAQQEKNKQRLHRLLQQVKAKQPVEKEETETT